MSETRFHPPVISCQGDFSLGLVKSLEENGYLHRFKIWIDGHIDWRSIVSDEPLTKPEFVDLQSDYIARLQENNPTVKAILPKKQKCIEEHKSNTALTGTLPQAHCGNNIVRGTIRCKSNKKRNTTKSGVKSTASAAEFLDSSAIAARDKEKSVDATTTSKPQVVCSDVNTPAEIQVYVSGLVEAVQAVCNPSQEVLKRLEPQDTIWVRASDGLYRTCCFQDLMFTWDSKVLIKAEYKDESSGYEEECYPLPHDVAVRWETASTEPIALYSHLGYA